MSKVNIDKLVVELSNEKNVDCGLQIDLEYALKKQGLKVENGELVYIKPRTPKFDIGNFIKHKSGTNVYLITDMNTSYYFLNDDTMLDIDAQDRWEICTPPSFEDVFQRDFSAEWSKFVKKDEPKKISFTQNQDIDVDKMVNEHRRYLYEHNASFTYSNIYDFVMDFYRDGILDALAEIKKISK